jgi:hypothetical protein
LFGETWEGETKGTWKASLLLVLMLPEAKENIVSRMLAECVDDARVVWAPGSATKKEQRMVWRELNVN